ncbi:MAG: hypothetical protein U9R50_00955 [Campylobacterota bacterium]|nr:hypothetical protein [Campylobacterota bacterium]
MNIFNTKVKPSCATEVFETLFQNECIKIEHIQSNTFSEGEWYDQEVLEWVFLAKGEAQLEFEDEIKNLVAGDYLLIQAHQRHRVLSSSKDAHWIALHVSH